MNTLKISSLKSLGKKPVFNLRMKGSQHNYVLANGLISKNSHAAAYALIAYWTAWLKTYYPTEFMCANLICDFSNTEQVIRYITECKRLGIKIEPPDINSSGQMFTIEDDHTITIEQYPLLIGFAITIHRSQGQTLEQGTILLDNSIWEDGQAYVALSRLQTIDKLALLKYDPDVFKVSKKVKQFYKGFDESKII